MKRILFLCSLIWCCGMLNAKDNVRVACVGNSITYGIGVEDRAHDAYPAQLQQRLGEGFTVGSFGKPGATLLNKGHRPFTQQKEYQEALDFKADIAVIHLGVNDTDPRNWPNYRDEFVKDYVDLIRSFKHVNPDMRIIIASITPIWDRHPRFVSGTKDWQDDIRNKIAAVAEICHVQLIDFYHPLYKYPFMFPDAIHPNVEGAGILADIVCSAITGNYGGLQLAGIYSDNMVIQQGEPFVMTGTANANDRIRVKIDGKEYTTKADLSGQWKVVTDAMKAKRGLTLTVTGGKQHKTFKNVAVGEVWLCSGQSNMEFMLKNAIGAKEDIAASANEDIRLFDMKARWRTNAVEWDETALDSVNHLLYYNDPEWTVCNPDAVKDFSAIAYHFGKMLQDSLQVTVGLICNAIGGATTESWIDRNTLETQFHPILRDWTHNDFIQAWARGRAAQNIKKAQSKLQRHPYEPCYLFESGILPLNRYPIKGAVWYQGESNAHNMEAHEKLFKLLTGSWREYWGKEDLPFYFVQLSSLNRPSWPWFRDSQRRLMMEIPHTGMAVSSDQGDSLDVHPRNKKPIGERLARWALAETYHHQLTPSGPLFKEAKTKGNTGEVYVSFDYADGLCASAPDGGLNGFEVAEYEDMFYPAEAIISGRQVIVKAKEVKHPRYVRYGWQPFSRANLVNADRLPASTFRAEVK